MTVDQLTATLAASGALYAIRPGMVISATFPRREQRDGFAARFRGATVRAAGSAFVLSHERTWCDEDGHGLLLSPPTAH